jgi:hypothetical protein
MVMFDKTLDEGTAVVKEQKSAKKVRSAPRPSAVSRQGGKALIGVVGMNYYYSAK